MTPPRRRAEPAGPGAADPNAADPNAAAPNAATPKPAVPQSAKLGDLGERAAAAFLERAGYRVISSALRTRIAEIDLLVRRRRTWVAVEVKTRRHHPAPERTVTDAQRDRLRRALAALAPSLRPRPRALRIDVLAVRVVDANAVPPTLELRHFPGVAFAPTTPR